MHSKVGIAMWAIGLPATAFTDQHRRIATTVEKDQYLFLAFQCLPDLLNQGLTDAMLFFCHFQVNHMHLGQACNASTLV